MTFRITVQHDRKNYRFNVEQLPSDKSFDYYKVIARNKTITFKNNAPILRRHSAKHRRPDWSSVKDGIWNVSFEQKIIEQLNKHLGY